MSSSQRQCRERSAHSHMTDSAILASGTAIATIIASLTAAIVAVAALRKTTATAASVTANAVTANKKADILIEKTAEIHTLTNSRMAKVTADLEVALAEIKALKERLGGMNDAKAIADQVAARLAETRHDP